MQFGWDGWLDGIEAQAEERVKADAAEAQVQKQMEKMHRIISRMVNTALSNAFEGWWSSVEKQRQGRETCRKILHRMQHAALSRAFDEFFERVEESKETKQKLAQALSRWQRPCLQFGWEGWLDHIANAAEARAQAVHDANAKRMQELEASLNELGSAGEHAQKSHAERARQAAEAQAQKQIETARRVVAKMMKASLANAFEGWLKGAQLQRQGRETCTKIVQRMQHAALSRAFDEFLERVEESKETKQKLARALSRWQQPYLQFGWNGWLGYIADKADAQLNAAYEAQTEAHAKEILRLGQENTTSREEQEREVEKREAALRAEFERRLQEEALERAHRDADVMGQLQVLEADLANEVLRAAKKMQILEDAKSGFSTPSEPVILNKVDVHQVNRAVPRLNLPEDQSTPLARSYNGANGKIYDPNGKVYGIGGKAYYVDVTGNTDGADQLLEAQTRLAELKQQRASLGAKIHAKLADVNLSLEEYKLPLMRSQDLDSRSLIRDSYDATSRKLRVLQKELMSSQKSCTSRPLPGHPALRDLKEVRPQQGPHSHFEGAAVLPNQLPKGYSVASHGHVAHQLIMSPRSKDVKQIIAELKKSSRHVEPTRSGHEDEICGRPGWFRS